MHARVLATAVHRSAAHDAQCQNLELNSHDTVPLNDDEILFSSTNVIFKQS